MATTEISKLQTPNPTRQKGLNALIEELGVSGMVEFVRQFNPGKGDYTKEREALLADITMEDIERYLAEKNG